MCRVTEGTTMNGYRCDIKGCDRTAVYTPLVIVPYERKPIIRENMFVGMVDVHVCPEHFKELDADQLLGPKMRELAKETANRTKQKPAFERVALAPWRVHSSEYIDFQRAGGFVPLDDADASKKVPLPG